MIPGVVCLCSRGLVHSRTIEAVAGQIPDGWKWVLSSDLGIPAAQNSVTQRARDLDPDWLWFVEEDIVSPSGFLKSALEFGWGMASGDDKFWDVIAADYPLKDQPGVARLGRNGPVYAGMGCLLVRATVFDRIPQPWFEAAQWSYDKVGDKWTRVHHGVGRIYGGQDIHFFAQLHNAGIPFKLLPGKCQHLKVVEYGRPGVNDGCHKIEAL